MQLGNGLQVIKWSVNRAIARVFKTWLKNYWSGHGFLEAIPWCKVFIGDTGCFNSCIAPTQMRGQWPDACTNKLAHAYAQCWCVSCVHMSRINMQVLTGIPPVVTRVMDIYAPGEFFHHTGSFRIVTRPFCLLVKYLRSCRELGPMSWR